MKIVIISGEFQSEEVWEIYNINIFYHFYLAQSVKAISSNRLDMNLALNLELVLLFNFGRLSWEMIQNLNLKTACVCN